jgi:hypothetical protein
MSNYQKSMPSQREIPIRFSKSTILQIVKEIENGSISRKETCNRYEMAYVTGNCRTTNNDSKIGMFNTTRCSAE